MTTPISHTNHRIDAPRLWASLLDMARIGATPAGGVNRLSLTEEDRQARARFRALCEQSNLAVRTDAMGNIFARRPGRDPSRPPVLFGSHLDSQPTGGRFDGALGVMAGLELIRTLDDLGLETEAPLELVNWTDEEGSRFGRSLMGSGVWSGLYDAPTILALQDATGTTVAEALAAIDASGPEPARAFPADAYFELHIEQGPILEREQKTIGIVTSAQAQVWYSATITGQDAHAGTTPPSARRDALVTAAQIVALVDRLMRARGEQGRGTVGRFQVLPGSANVIPGEVRFSVEFRHPDTAEITALDTEFRARAQALATAANTPLALTELVRMPAQPFDPACVALVRDAAARLGHPAREIVSGAGHDAVSLARCVPSAMIFTPCKDGLSHNEAESIEPHEAAAGCQVLFDAVLARANRPLP